MYENNVFWILKHIKNTILLDAPSKYISTTSKKNAPDFYYWYLHLSLPASTNEELCSLQPDSSMTSHASAWKGASLLAAVSGYIYNDKSV